jgi:hypothetical protein
MKRLLAHHEEGVEKRITECLAEQTRKHDEDLKALKQSQAAATTMFANPSRVISYKVAENYKNMTKASDNVLFDVNADNSQAFEDHLTKEAASPTIGWSKYILGFQITGQGPVINLLKTYFDIPSNMIAELQDDLKNTKEEDLNNLDMKLYTLKALKAKLRNCLTHSVGDHIEESMPMDISNNNGRILFLSNHLTHLSRQGCTQRNHQKIHAGTKNNQIKFLGIISKRPTKTLEGIGKY